MKNRRDTEMIERWWGRSDWKDLYEMPRCQRIEVFTDRFRQELGYEWAQYYEIRNRNSGDRIMYYMIHATDHPAAPGLMERAYRKAVEPKESQEQLSFILRNVGVKTSS